MILPQEFAQSATFYKIVAPEHFLSQSTPQSVLLIRPKQDNLSGKTTEATETTALPEVLTEKPPKLVTKQPESEASSKHFFDFFHQPQSNTFGFRSIHFNTPITKFSYNAKTGEFDSQNDIITFEDNDEIDSQEADFEGEISSPTTTRILVNETEVVTF